MVLGTLEIIILVILAGIFLSALKILKGNSSGSGKKMDAEEAQTMQEIHRGLTTLENRIESLETLLLERARDEKWADLERDK